MSYATPHPPIRLCPDSRLNPNGGQTQTRLFPISQAEYAQADLRSPQKSMKTVLKFLTRTGTQIFTIERQRAKSRP